MHKKSSGMKTHPNMAERRQPRIPGSPVGTKKCWDTYQWSKDLLWKWGGHKRVTWAWRPQWRPRTWRTVTTLVLDRTTQDQPPLCPLPGRVHGHPAGRGHVHAPQTRPSTAHVPEMQHLHLHLKVRMVHEWVTLALRSPQGEGRAKEFQKIQS